MSRRVLLDAGNSRLKWALLDNERWLAQGHCAYADLAALKSLLCAGDRGYVASVAPDACEEVLRALFMDAELEAVWLRPAAIAGGVRNGYADPSSLGVDRWMALIGARRRTDDAVLVVSAGTAMTVDALSAAGEFLGGVIVPGAGLMRQALQTGTARVPATSGRWQAFPRRTADAVESGIVAALCGAIRQQHAALAAVTGAAPRCLLTGGDAPRLAAHLDLDFELAPALVLEGIEYVTREPVPQ
jgi:type III pantothenate kinase